MVSILGMMLLDLFLKIPGCRPCLKDARSLASETLVV